jgi:hypothetical protein
LPAGVLHVEEQLVSDVPHVKRWLLCHEQLKSREAQSPLADACPVLLFVKASPSRLVRRIVTGQVGRGAKAISQPTVAIPAYNRASLYLAGDYSCGLTDADWSLARSLRTLIDNGSNKAGRIELVQTSFNLTHNSVHNTF